MIHPSLDEFKRLAKTHSLVPVYLECLADELSPLAYFHARYQDSATSFLLESVEGGEHLGRYSFAAFAPHQIFRARGGNIALQSGNVTQKYRSDDPLKELSKLLGKQKAAHLKGLPRFYGGAVGYVGYDMVRSFEKLPTENPDKLGLPDSVFFLTRDMFIFDHLSHTLKIVRCVPISKGHSPEKQYREAERALKKMAADIHMPQFSLKPYDALAKVLPEYTAAERKAYLDAVKKAKEYIAAGDIIQTVLSRRTKIEVDAHPLEIYRALRRVNPSPYMYFLRDGDNHIIGSSPEMLVRLEDRKAETRPIAGTRPRVESDAANQKAAEELAKDKKERAEHLMLVDLGRNDLGRVCKPGTVKVPEFMTIEQYSHVMHLVSTVTGELDEHRDAFDLFRACFPAGTLTGAPKIRAMQIIDELEKVRRGPYGGSVGYFSYSGNMDMAITIRTIVLKGREAYIQAGAGIVADSDPEKEFEETQNKAAAMATALRIAQEGAEK